MHDPMTVAFEIRRPFPQRGRPILEKDKSFKFLIRKRLGAPWYSRHAWWLSSYIHAFGKAYYFPALVTVWHRDPEAGGDDDSCRRAAARRAREAGLEHHYFKALIAQFVARHVYALHIHHWKIQVNWWQHWRRFLFTRCEFCGKRFKLHYGPIHVYGYSKRKDNTDFNGKFRKLKPFESEINLFHWGHCADIASIVMKKRGLEAGHKSWREEDYEPYYGCYSWWRARVLGEDTSTAMKRAETHVQRSSNKCSSCDGEGQTLVSAFDPADEHGEVRAPLTDATRNRIVWITTSCPDCEGTGHRRVDNPISNEKILAVSP